MRKALAVYRKELRQILRDRRTLLILVFIPALFLLLYGYALNFDIRHIALAVEDRDGSAESRSVVSAFVNSGYFDLVATVHSPAEIERLVNLNRARAVLVIPEGLRPRHLVGTAGAGAGDHRRRQREHGDDGARATRPTSCGLSAQSCRRRPSSGRRRWRSSRASGTTPSFAARCFWSPASSPTSA